MIKVYLPDKIGKGYKDFWNFKGRYRVCKGSRASKKSKTTALNFIFRIMKYPEANLLVVRKTYRTLRDSCFAELKWAIRTLEVSDYFDIKNTPLDITYIPTGQKIYFRGLDDPLKITSIVSEVGSLCWLWIEEAYEVVDESAFDILQESIRGRMEDGLFKQITLTFNPWNENHWLKRRFFDNPDEDTFTVTTNYMINEWLDDADITMYNNMKKYNPRRYQVAGLGNWGITDGLVFDRVTECNFDVEDIIANNDVESIFGLDFGYTNDPSALFCGLIDINKHKIYVFDEIYQKKLTNKLLANEIIRKGYQKEIIVADAAEPKSIVELSEYKISRVRPAKKGKDSILNGIQYIQNYDIIIHKKCVNFINEVNNYAWAKDRLSNKPINKPIDNYNHLMDAMRYAIERYSTSGGFSF